VTKPLRRSTEIQEPEVLCHFHRPWLGAEEEKEVIETLRSGWLTTGPKTREFERCFADYVGCRHAIGLNSCTSALHVGLVSLGIGPGDELNGTKAQILDLLKLLDKFWHRGVANNTGP